MTTPLNIHIYRKRAGMTQAQLAEQLHIHPATMSRLESGKQELTERMERRIARVLGLTGKERNHMLGAGFGVPERAPRPGSDRHLWLVGTSEPEPAQQS